MSEERKKEFFEYGQKISRKLGIPEKVEKTNAFYARHPKAMSFAIFGFCCLLLLLSEVCLRGSGMSVHRPVGEQPSDYTASTLFEAMEIGMTAKLEIMRLYPDMSNFTVKAFYEKDPEVCSEIQESYHRHFNLKVDRIRLNLEPDQFVPGLDIPMMYREMYWAAEGYLWEMLQAGDLDIDRVEKDFRKLMAFWKNNYKKKD